MKIIAIMCTFGALNAADICEQWITSTTASTRALSPDEPMTWQQLDDECAHQYRGYRLLRDRHRSVVETDTRICGDTLVPLGVKKIGDQLYWISRNRVELEKLLPEGDVENMELGNVGALNVTSGALKLVPDDFLFNCAFCQVEDDHLGDQHTSTIDFSKFQKMKKLAQDSSQVLKNAIREMMISMKSKNLTNVTGFVRNSPALIQNISKLYGNAVQSKRDLLTEGYRWLKSTSDAPIQPQQLGSVTSVASDLIDMNTDTLLDVDKAFYAQTLELVKIDELITYLHVILKSDSNFLWSQKITTQRIIKRLEKIAVNVDLGDKDFATSGSPNTIVFVADVEGKGNPIVGFSLTDQINNFTIDVLRHQMDPSLDQASYTVLIPPSVIHSGSRVAAVVFAYKEAAFPDKQLKDITETVGYLTPVIQFIFSDTNASQPSQQELFVDIIFNSEKSKNHKSISKYVKSECSYWSSELKSWTTHGCQLMSSSHGSHDMCRCMDSFEEQCTSVSTAQYILENWNDFAAYLIKNRIEPKSKKNALGFISLIGYSFSFLGLLFLLITYIAFSEWNKEFDNTALLHLCLAVSLNFALLFIATIVQVPPGGVACIAIGAALHYTFIACFTWLLTMSGLQLMGALNDLRNSHGATLATILTFGWGIPLIPVATLLSWQPGLYVSVHDRGFGLETGGPSYIVAVQSLHTAIMSLFGLKQEYLQEIINKEVCYPTGMALHVGERIPVAMILGFNIVVIVVTVCVVYLSTNEIISPGVIRRLICHLVMIILLGLPWAFSCLAFIGVNEVFAYVFCVIVATHGVALFILFVVLDSRAVDCWNNACRKSNSYVIKYDEPSTVPRYRGEICREFNRRNFFDIDDEASTSGFPGESFEMTSGPFNGNEQLTKSMELGE